MSLRHREYCSTTAITFLRFIRVAATLLLHSLQSGNALYILATTNVLMWQLYYLGIVNLGTSAMLQLHSWHSGQLKAWFKCPLKVGFALLDSMTNSERFHFHVIDK